MGMAAMFNGAEPFEKKKTVNIRSIEGPMWNLVEIVRAISEQKTFKDFTILCMYIAKGQGQITPRGNFLW